MEYDYTLTTELFEMMVDETCTETTAKNPVKVTPGAELYFEEWFSWN